MILCFYIGNSVYYNATVLVAELQHRKHKMYKLYVDLIRGK